MAHPNEDLARSATQALAKRDLEGFLSHHADDVIVHFPGRGPLAGEYRGKNGVAQLFQRQMQMLDSPPEMENHDVLASDDHAVVLTKVRGTRGGQTLEQQQVAVIHVKGGKVAEVWLLFSEQQAMDEMASS
ncbi:MAG TPA: nuclear transport factor 2 family protein [Actinomycetes bacterium]|jgi:ketosteroid isomerase-like protein|nr:nuclear transport factor 2 family protein [Actinomycetes bacterium]